MIKLIHKKPGYSRPINPARPLNFLQSLTGFMRKVLFTKDTPRQERWETACCSVAEAHALTPRELDVLKLLSVGRNVKRISEILGVSRHTVKSHAHQIYQKTEIHSQQELIDLVERNSGEAYVALF